MKILLVYPEFPDTFWSFKHAVTFIGKKAGNPPLGLATIAAMLPTQWEKRLVDMNVTRLKQSDLEWADFVFISAMDVQRASVRTLIARCKTSQKIMVAGGPLFTADYEHFPDVNYFVLNEGEITLPLFLADLEKGTPQRVYKTDEYPDIRSTPVPMWELVDKDKYELDEHPVLQGLPV